MKTAKLKLLKADFLEWTGGFDPETDDDIAAYVTTSMPFELDEGEASRALRQWMREADSHHIGGNTGRP